MTEPLVLPEFHRTPHRVAVALVCATFPLIWVGGLVTTYGAGMAVPDWPGTYGYNLFLYPWQTWIAGPWDLFIEHGHRLLGAAVGLLAIALVAAVCFQDPRRWMRWMAVGGLLLVIVQGLLGGQRVLLDDRRVAQLHACLGPTFFTYACLMAAATSAWWHQAAGRAGTPLQRQRLRQVAVAAGLTCGLAFCQLALGSQLRHGVEYASRGVFRGALLLHVAGALLLPVQVIWLGMKTRAATADRRLRRPAALLAWLTVAQVMLGLATWTAKYGWPAAIQPRLVSAGFIIQAESLSQSVIVTAHVAVGTLVLALAALLCFRALRLAAACQTGGCQPVESADSARRTPAGVLS